MFNSDIVFGVGSLRTRSIKTLEQCKKSVQSQRSSYHNQIIYTVSGVIVNFEQISDNC